MSEMIIMLIGTGRLSGQVAPPVGASPSGHLSSRRDLRAATCSQLERFRVTGIFIFSATGRRRLVQIPQRSN